MRVLVTGGAGFIGAHTCKALAAVGVVPITYDDLSTGHRDAVKWGPFEHGDVRNSGRLTEVLSKHDVDAVLHFAAAAYVGESTTDPAKYYDINVAGTMQLLDSMRVTGVQRIVFSSSCATYGVPKDGIILENSEQKPINPYGRTKLACEQMIDDYVASYGLGAVHLRYFNAAGSDPDLEIGECHSPETHLIPLTLRAALGLIPHLQIFGDDYSTPDGTCIRDYIHVLDLASAHIKALGICASGESRRYNVGAGCGTSVRQIVALTEEVTNRKVPVRIVRRRAGDPPELVAAIEKAREELGWEPRHSDIRSIIEHAWAWAQKVQTA